ncbi:NAD-dependent epimerase/dehydratase family protein [Actinobacillus equuli subsp. equuli]|uniref:NAD-dependent epimerase/dehydratase family protein n=1 Tax=Actinobacillus equuli TaxID=718 RepID=UPI0024419285|nr:NAD-dependent epimerase/dehydratase family protein [Actinobacillus equuli]WGE54974.1 NAD-dependent epimerase/dehydratase family protein [Actinobacillus equuli subsp. equuli]
MKDLVLKEDLEFIANKVFTQGAFNHSTVLVTGATGLIGSLIVKSILYANQMLNSQITVLASVRNLEKAKEIFADFSDKNLMFVTNSLSSQLHFEQAVDFIVHTASITASKEMVENPVGVLLTAFESTKNLLDYVKENPSCKMVYISSMEYYGQVMDDYTNVTEAKLGYIDLSKPRSCYPESKRVCEALCNAYVAQYNLSVCSARLAQTFGAGVPFSDNRVFAQFAKSAINKTDIILHTTGQSEGNYCYTADAVYGIFLLLQKGENGQGYNVARNHSTILNMAKMVADKIGKNQIKAEVRIPEDLGSLGYAPDVKLKLNSDKLKALGWQPEIDLENMFRRMIRSWELQG